jgi:hypothetical protein
MLWVVTQSAELSQGGIRITTWSARSTFPSMIEQRFLSPELLGILRASLAVGLHASVALASITPPWGTCLLSECGMHFFLPRLRWLVLGEAQNRPPQTNGNRKVAVAHLSNHQKRAELPFRSLIGRPIVNCWVFDRVHRLYLPVSATRAEFGLAWGRSSVDFIWSSFAVPAPLAPARA